MGRRPATNAGAIIERRTALGMRQATLAQKAGLSRSCLAKIETGDRQGSLETIKCLADVLGCTVLDLLISDSGAGAA